ncbi:MAG: hypothetical protein ACI379_10430 [Nocardioides sp.]|uniref:hypothetical protein n=1 Tax=Nocardioides sp. TaxID=35761 RepID=UPI003F0B2740
MQGLSVRWSLEGVDDAINRQLAEYVATASHAKFTGMAGLRFKTWRLSPGHWMEGTYVFASDAARAEFQTTFEAGAADAPISQLVGAPPALIEAHEVLAVAEGWEGFTTDPDHAGLAGD